MWGMSAADAALVQQDFSQPIATRFSTDVGITSNATDLTSRITAAVQVSPETIAAPASGSQATVVVQSNVPGLTWSAQSDVDWISIIGGPTGIGTGTVRYSVLQNTTGTPRVGAIIVAGVRLQVTQGQ